MLQELERHFSARTSFAFETTLSGRGYLRQIKKWQSEGYRVKLIFLRLGSAEQAIARVAQRVKQGGHHIPEDVIRRRFLAGMDNFEKIYAPLVDAWALYDNSGPAPVLIGQAQDRDIRLSQVALERAVQRAHALAKATNTTIVVSNNGVIEHRQPETKINRLKS